MALSLLKLNLHRLNTPNLSTKIKLISDQSVCSDTVFQGTRASNWIAKHSVDGSSDTETCATFSVA